MAKAKTTPKKKEISVEKRVEALIGTKLDDIEMNQVDDKRIADLESKLTTLMKTQ